jgi:hypothetical protein
MMVLQIAQINMLRNRAKDELNTLVGINQMQYLKGFESAVENVYLEANRSRDIDGFVSDECCKRLLNFIEDISNILESPHTIHFIKGQLAAYSLCKSTIEQCLTVVK